jgi:hypothetical protein
VFTARYGLDLYTQFRLNVFFKFLSFLEMFNFPQPLLSFYHDCPFHKATDLFAVLSFRFHIVELTEFEFLYHTRLLRLSFTYRQSLPSSSHCRGPPAVLLHKAAQRLSLSKHFSLSLPKLISPLLYFSPIIPQHSE